MSFLSGIAHYVREAFSLNNSSKIGDLRISFNQRSKNKTMSAVAASIFNPPALPVANLQLPVRIIPTEIINFKRFAARIRRHDAQGGAQWMLALGESLPSGVLKQRATQFLSRFQQVYLPTAVKAPLFAVSRLISGDQLMDSINCPIMDSINCPIMDSINCPIVDSINCPIMDSINCPKFLKPFTSNLNEREIPEFKSLYKRADEGDSIASFKLFQIYWTDPVDQKNEHLVAIEYLVLSRLKGNQAAVAAEQLIDKCRRDDLLETPIFRILITNMDPYADGFRMAGTTLGKTVNFGANFLEPTPEAETLRVPLPVEPRLFTAEEILEKSQSKDRDVCFQLFEHFSKLKSMSEFADMTLTTIANRLLPFCVKNSKEIAFFYLKKAAKLKHPQAIKLLANHHKELVFQGSSNK